MDFFEENTCFYYIQTSNLHFLFFVKLGLALFFSASTVRMKTIASHHSTENRQHLSEGSHCYCEGPQRSLQRDFGHISVELHLLGGKKKRLQVN